VLLARFEGRRLVVLDRYKDSVRMAAGLQEDGNLSPDVMARALTALKKIAERIRPLPKSYVRVVGTNTLRAASNRDVFLVQAEKILGVPINIISGLEEARLIYLGVAKDFTPEDKTRLVVDIGGGSTELVLGRNKPLKLESLYMGCVAFSREFFPDGRISRRAYEKAVLAARSEVQGLVSEFGAGNWEQAVGSSGTIRSIERVLDGMGLNRNHVITPAGLAKLAEAVIAAKSVEQLALLPGLDADRAQVFAGGLAVLHGVFAELKIAAMHVSMYAIREGIIYDLAGRLHQRDKRVETIAHMMEQYRIDQAQARRVGRLAARLLAQVESRIDTEIGQARRLLQWAVDLHEIGLSIAHSGYHKHGAYIVANSDMPGFSRQEQQLLSFLVLNHRRKLRPEPAAYGFVPDWRLVTVLRLACLFLRRRSAAQMGRGISLSFNGSRCRLKLPGQWLERHPLTREDLLQEKQLLAAVGIELALSTLP
jgi:exopolyphosphatase/guanosine-5'-triphosphate,3'-diphosphate pyrophosphatase